ncbi:MAG: hypothetical protein DMF91_07745 [Acidobacteria bacterium]|nr:MAG: hypothetical protein DMF91_07745 [Acidobacteriota bacterium]
MRSGGAQKGTLMRTNLVAGVLSLSLVLAGPRATCAQATPPGRAADVARIRAEIERICQAFVDKDPQTLTATHGKDWRGFTPESGHVIRGLDGYMNEATFDPGTPKGQGMIAYHLSDFDVVFYGDTAVASFVLDTEVAYGQDTHTQKLTILDVFHKEPAGWIQVASNTSFHPDEIGRRVSTLRQLGDDERKALLAAREGVWRAWFAGARPAGVDHARELGEVRYARVECGRLARIRRLRYQARAPRLPAHRVPGIRQHRHPLYDVRTGAR